MKKNKGFTLIELLAVIVILGVIMVIAIPFVMGYIERSKKTSFEDTAYGIISSAQYYTTNLENGEEYVTSITCDYNKCGNLSFKGKVPSGVVNIYDDYTISLSITDGNYCAYKNGNETAVKVLEGKCTGVTVMQYAAGESEDETITNLQNQIVSMQNQLNTLSTTVDNKTTGIELSYTEKLTGDKWVNGKPIYAITINFGTLPNATTKAINHGIANIDNVWVDMQNSYVYTGTVTFAANFGSWWYPNVSKTAIAFNCSDNRTAYTGVVTLRYTKTTD